MIKREIKTGSRDLSSAKEAEKRWRYNSVDRELRELIVGSCRLSVEGIDKSAARAAATRGPDSGKLKNLHY
jgi:hypothetical protein